MYIVYFLVSHFFFFLIDLTWQVIKLILRYYYPKLWKKVAALFWSDFKDLEFHSPPPPNSVQLRPFYFSSYRSHPDRTSYSLLVLPFPAEKNNEKDWRNQSQPKLRVRYRRSSKGRVSV